MEIKWTYLIIVALYILIIATKILVTALNSKYLNQGHVTALTVFRKDFLTIVASCSFVGMIIISILTTIGGMPFNFNAFWITLLLVILSFFNSFAKILILDNDTYILLGEKVESENINEILITDKSNKIKIITNKSVAYEFYTFNNDKKYFHPVNNIGKNQQ
ncbi:MAG: hypothetical protein ATN31_10715 [Candidatus Epulonipiscioides saccharophilum]|nr:MAG: hypothetical protein ATN31_10715 [Epulopiscium sp. AS2M-Bin001]